MDRSWENNVVLSAQTKHVLLSVFFCFALNHITSPTDKSIRGRSLVILTGAMAPISLEKGLAATAEEARPSWAGAKAAAEATREAMIIDFMVMVVGFIRCILNGEIMWGVRRDAVASFVARSRLLACTHKPLRDRTKETRRNRGEDRCFPR